MRSLRTSVAVGLGAGWALGGCSHTVKVEPIRVEPIDITLRIYLEAADQKLDSFFDYQEPPADPPAPGGGSAPGEGATP